MIFTSKLNRIGIIFVTFRKSSPKIQTWVPSLGWISLYFALHTTEYELTSNEIQEHFLLSKIILCYIAPVLKYET